LSALIAKKRNRSLPSCWRIIPAPTLSIRISPLVQIHTEALKASTHGYCVAKAGGNDAFFKFSDALFASQAGLTPATSDATLKDAETKAGQDPAKIAACAETAAAKDAIKASLALGEQVGVSSTRPSS